MLEMNPKKENKKKWNDIVYGDKNRLRITAYIIYIGRSLSEGILVWYYASPPLLVVLYFALHLIAQFIYTTGKKKINFINISKWKIIYDIKIWAI